MILKPVSSVEVLMMFTGGKIKQYRYSQFMFNMSGKQMYEIEKSKSDLLRLSVPLLSVFNIAIAVTFCNLTN